MKIRSTLYRIASLLGDIKAVQSGPSHIVRRIIRKKLTVKANGLIRRLFK